MNVVDIYAALDAIHVIITQDEATQGWFFYDSDEGFDSGDGELYELSEDAAYAGAEFYGLLGNDDEEVDPFNSDAEADADVLASAGWGTDEDYGYYGGDE
jgi:hypothetical protein